MLESNDTSPEFHSITTPPPAPSAIPQFANAEYSHIPGTERCRICGNLIPGDYYRINGQMVCTTCAGQALNGQPADSHAAFARGLLFGAVAALLGLIGYATVTIATGWSIGYVALGVGWLVAKAITKGSNGLGGRRYQIAAVLLTYAAISVAAIPIGISYAVKHQKAVTVKKTSDNPFPEDNSSQPAPSKPKPEVHLGSMIGELLLMGLASPFLALQNPFQGAIGLFILFIGLRIAWQLTAARRLPVDGPYSAASA